MKPCWNWRRWPFALAAFLLAGGEALAHEKWFIDHRASEGIGTAFSIVTPAFAILAPLVIAALYLAVAWIDRRYDGSPVARWLDAKLLSLGFHPRTVLGAAVGVSLMGAGLQGTLFAPSLVLPGTGWGMALGLSQIVLGALFLFLEPLYAELGALLALLYLAGFTALPFADHLEELLMLGAGVYFMTSETGRAPWRGWNTPERRRIGYQVFRVLIGLTFLILSSVKWLRPDLALGIVAAHDINFLARAGASDAQFVYLSAVIETIVALCILLRVAFRPAVALAFFFFLVSVFFLGFRELLGHLPVKGALLLLFLYGHWHEGEEKP